MLPFFVHRDLDNNHVTRFYPKNAVRGGRRIKGICTAAPDYDYSPGVGTTTIIGMMF